MSPRQAALSKYYPYLFAGAIVLVSVASYQIYTSRSSPRLNRSNARRVNPRRRNHNQTSRDPDPGGVITNEQLHQALSQDVEPGRIDIPESIAEALTETGHAAQEARGAGSGGGGDGREGRAGRRSSDQESEFSFTPETKENIENQNLLTLLYTIAQDQAQRESYVHRGVTCNNCQIVPIRGIRYRCANCLDYDLCEICEQDSSHPKTHLFYKIRIPAPFIGNPRHAQVPCYPGKPQMMPISLGPETLKHLSELTKFEQPELEALYEQFKCLAASEYNDTKFSINGAISRDTFDKCFRPNAHIHPTSPNLIYDRMFSFYDTKSDNMIDFEEFVVGVSFTNNKLKSPNRLRKIFNGYDLNNDGFVERKDFQRMFKAFYTLSKDLVRDIVASLGDELYDPQHMDTVLMGRQPTSAAFTSSIPAPAMQRPWQKPVPPGGQDADEEDDSDAPVVLPRSEDSPDDEADKPSSRRSSIEGKESKKVLIEKERKEEFWNFAADDDEEDEDLMLPDEERDIGSEVLFQMSMKGINELLDMLFAAKERAAIEARLLGSDKDGELSPTPEAASVEAASVESPASSNEEKENKDSNTSATSPSATTPPKPKETPETKRKNRRENTRMEIRQRGGEGRLSYEEFEKIMNGKDKTRLDFVSTWTDLASF